MKGVNKQIIEVVNTENECFERALLFVKPDKLHLSQKEKLREAGRYVRRLSRERGEESRESKRYRFLKPAAGILKFAGAAAIGAAAAFLLK